MEKTIDKISNTIDENEKLIANILHDIKSPLFSIKLALEKKLDTQLNVDIFETVVDVLEYIENFLVDYSFKIGKFKNKTVLIDIKNLITQKIENYKYIFINKNIHIDIIQEENEDFKISQIGIFLSSIIGNIISNIAFHASKNSNAQIIIKHKLCGIYLEFKNAYDIQENNFNLGLDFCKKLMCKTQTKMSFSKTKDNVIVKLNIPDLRKGK